MKCVLVCCDRILSLYMCACFACPCKCVPTIYTGPWAAVPHLEASLTPILDLRRRSCRSQGGPTDAMVPTGGLLHADIRGACRAGSTPPAATARLRWHACHLAAQAPPAHFVVVANAARSEPLRAALKEAGHSVQIVPPALAPERLPAALSHRSARVRRPEPQPVSPRSLDFMSLFRSVALGGSRWSAHATGEELSGSSSVLARRRAAPGRSPAATAPPKQARRHGQVPVGRGWPTGARACGGRFWKTVRDAQWLAVPLAALAVGTAVAAYALEGPWPPRSQ